jgi:putative ABC transport system permease protein
LMTVAGLVLLIACANVASLMLARASVRQREIAVRMAIGAGRVRVVRQLLIESTLLSLIGAACGVGLAWVATRTLVDLISGGPEMIVFDLAPNMRVLSFTTILALATGMLFGIAPALQSTAVGPSATLKEDARTTTSRSRLLPVLVTVQVAVALVLLAGAGLFVRTLRNLQTLDPGFTAGGVVVANLEGRQATIPSDVLADVRRLPGIGAASLATHTPLNGWTWSEPAVPAGQPLPERDTATFVGADPGFFDALQIRLISGRVFRDSDAPAGPFVAVVNEVYAHRYFGDQSPIGQHLSAKVSGRPEDLEIVGLVKSVNARGLRAQPPPIVYVAFAQVPGNRATNLIVRVQGPITGAMDSVQRTLQAKVPGASVVIRPLSAQVASTIVQERMMAMLAGTFGWLALTMTCVGLYGLLAYSVAQRTREIGIRMALGAQGARVVRSVLTSGVRLVGVGIMLGLPAAWGASRWIGSMLYGLTPTDPVTVGGAILILAVATLLAAFLPARRASRVDPLVALRHD